MRIWRSFLTLALLAGPAASSSTAQDWADQVFPERSFDLGSVARGSKLRHSFPVMNRTDRVVRIVDVQKKCGCTDVKLGAREIPPGTKTTIDVELDTTRFAGYKASGVTLVLDQPVARSIDLNLTSFIRTDIAVAPGIADFGVVPRDEPKQITLTINYTGPQPNWQVTKLETGPSGVTAELFETARNGTTVAYQLVVKLDPKGLNGPFKDEITMRTNDPSSPVLPLSVAALVQGRVTVSPATVVLGTMKPGQVTKTKVFARSAKPFKVTTADAKKGEVAALASDADDAKALHMIVVSFTAPDQPGPCTGVLEIATDVAEEPPARITLFATVAP